MRSDTCFTPCLGGRDLRGIVVLDAATPEEARELLGRIKLEMTNEHAHAIAIVDPAIRASRRPQHI